MHRLVYGADAAEAPGAAGFRKAEAGGGPARRQLPSPKA
jgi:hypothetical protein